MEKRQEIYDELCRALTEYEEHDPERPIGADALYTLLVKIQNCWEDCITSQ